MWHATLMYKCHAHTYTQAHTGAHKCTDLSGVWNLSVACRFANSFSISNFELQYFAVYRYVGKEIGREMKEMEMEVVQQERTSRNHFTYSHTHTHTRTQIHLCLLAPAFKTKVYRWRVPRGSALSRLVSVCMCVPQMNLPHAHFPTNAYKTNKCKTMHNNNNNNSCINEK
ncbi:unnamed protein product [Ceratitis capitata]|uniref:(Mediterranean fruit fly) hypothetical protein n=1 Tax=Ceratitis capitata TaxID=7213 RepID=A0A811U581_CERCA|nr:unnamed protein product [Ceratitis capitata]